MPVREHDRDESALRRRGLTAIDATMLLVIVLVIMQMWLLTATLDAYLAGHIEVVLPGALASAGLFIVCFLLYRFIARLDHGVREGKGPRVERY